MTRVSFVQANPKVSATKAAERLRSDALRDGGAGLFGNDPRSCRLIERVSELLYEQRGELDFELRGYPEIEHRILTVWPAGEPEPALGGPFPEFGHVRPIRQRPAWVPPDRR